MGARPVVVAVVAAVVAVAIVVVVVAAAAAAAVVAVAVVVAEAAAAAAAAAVACRVLSHFLHTLRSIAVTQFSIKVKSVLDSQSRRLDTGTPLSKGRL